MTALWQTPTTQPAGEHFPLPYETGPRCALLWQTAPDWLELIAQWHFSSALSLLGLLLTLLAIAAGSLAAWRFGADAGWTSSFFIANGVLSHWQVWCACAAGLQALAYTLHRTTEGKLGIAALILVKSPSGQREKKGTQ